MAQPVARTVADVGVRGDAAGGVADRDRDRVAVLYRLRARSLGRPFPFDVGWLKLPTFDWPTRPSWLYRLNQGLHVGLGLVVIPVVLAKLWSVLPRLFAWPPARSLAQVLERVTLLMLVGGILFEIVTGVLNIQYDYIFGFSFYTAHYFGAWVFIAAFVSHICLKLPKMVAQSAVTVDAQRSSHLAGRHGARTARPRRAGGTRP